MKFLDEFRTEADEDETPAHFIAAFAVFALWMIVLFVYLLIGAAAS